MKQCVYKSISTSVWALLNLLLNLIHCSTYLFPQDLIYVRLFLTSCLLRLSYTIIQTPQTVTSVSPGQARTLSNQSVVVISVFITLMSQGVVLSRSNRNNWAALLYWGHPSTCARRIWYLWLKQSVFTGWSAGSLSQSLISLLSEKEDKESI